MIRTVQKYRLSLSIIAGSTALLLASFAYAQSSAESASASEPAVPAGTVSCFDHYRFGSVQASISPDVSSAVSGTPITFTGSLENQNPYPIVDGTLYVKVFRLRDNAAGKNVNGPFVVDQFFVREGIVLPAGGRMPIAFSWDIPSYIKDGEYRVATFFTTSKKYNLLGLSFTDDVVGNTAQFHVSGEQHTLVEFDKDAVTVGGEPYRFAAFPPRTSATEPVAIQVLVRNETETDERVPVRWQVFAWDAGAPENLISQTDELILVKAGGTAPATHIVTDARYPVYLVVGTVGWKNTQSIINVRFVREGKDRLRINFPGITAFPLKKGEETTLFSCLHSTGESALVQDGRLELRLSDDRGRIIHEYTYTGDVTADMMGVAERFVPQTGYNLLILDALLYQGGTLVDEAHLTYDCRSIDPNSCLPEGETKAPLGSFAQGLPGGLALVSFGMLLIIFVVLVSIWRFTRKSSLPPPPIVG